MRVQGGRVCASAMHAKKSWSISIYLQARYYAPFTRKIWPTRSEKHGMASWCFQGLCVVAFTETWKLALLTDFHAELPMNWKDGDGCYSTKLPSVDSYNTFVTDHLWVMDQSLGERCTSKNKGVNVSPAVHASNKLEPCRAAEIPSLQ